MSIEAMKVEGPLHVVCKCDKCKAEKQEPVAWMDSDWHYQLHKKGMVVMHKDEGDVLIGKPQPLYTTPQQRTWVGLTDEELNAIYEQHHNQYAECISPNFGYEHAIEAKLKEKNT